MQNKQHRLKTILQENQYIIPSFEIYGGFSGYQDYGILGYTVKQKLLNIWRCFFLDNDVFEVETPIITPYEVLKASGHVDRFTDYVVHDEDGICIRADHLAKEWFKKNNMKELCDIVDSWDKNTLEFYINEYKMTKFPVKVENKNLMFEVKSLNKNKEDFLRPELAQSIFVNFKAYQQFLQKGPPFGIAQVGNSFRREICPKQFVRMRQFSQFELEYFVDPLNKTHNKFNEYKNTLIPILTEDMQKNLLDSINITIDEAINQQLINSEIMAYFLAKIYLFAIHIGLNKDKIRFRQHLSTEKAHYSLGCWDLEVFVNDDWLECVGCADRGSYDLISHSNNVKLTSRRIFDQPKISKILKIRPDMKFIGNKYKELTGDIVNFFNNLTQEEVLEIQKNSFGDETIDININNDLLKSVQLPTAILKIEEEIFKKEYEDYYPHVIEPSFGIDRILYSIFEHNFWVRENDEKRVVLSLPSVLTPYDIAIFALSKNDKLINIVNEIDNTLTLNGFRCYLDTSSTNIGKRYCRTDEIGIKYAITVDFDTLNDKQVTIRERDTMNQIRIFISNIIEVVASLK